MSGPLPFRRRLLRSFAVPGRPVPGGGVCRLNETEARRGVRTAWSVRQVGRRRLDGGGDVRGGADRGDPRLLRAGRSEHVLGVPAVDGVDWHIERRRPRRRAPGGQAVSGSEVAGANALGGVCGGLGLTRWLIRTKTPTSWFARHYRGLGSERAETT